MGINICVKFWTLKAHNATMEMKTSSSSPPSPQLPHSEEEREREKIFTRSKWKKLEAKWHILTKSIKLFSQYRKMACIKALDIFIWFIPWYVKLGQERWSLNNFAYNLKNYLIYRKGNQNVPSWSVHAKSCCNTHMHMHMHN